jgi:hypothetical protein
LTYCACPSSQLASWNALFEGSSTVDGMVQAETGLESVARSLTKEVDDREEPD